MQSTQAFNAGRGLRSLCNSLALIKIKCSQRAAPQSGLKSVVLVLVVVVVLGGNGPRFVVRVRGRAM